LGVALVVLSVELSSMFATGPAGLRQPSNTKILIHGHAASQQHVTGHPPLKAIADKLDCQAALTAAGGKQYALDKMQLLRYSETGGKPLLMDPHSGTIMGWIMDNPGERKVHEIFQHLLGTGAWHCQRLATYMICSEC
jgi:hypothetical protein